MLSPFLWRFLWLTRCVLHTKLKIYSVLVRHRLGFHRQKNKIALFNCTPHFSRVFCTVKKIHNKIHYCKNFIFDRFWTFLDILAKIRKKSENPEFVFSTQWKKCFFYSVEKMFFTLSRKNRLFFNLSRKNRVFYKWDKLKNKLSTLSKCGLQSNKASC